MTTITDTDTTQAEFQEGTLTDVEADVGGYIELSKRFADTDLYLSEVSGSGTTVAENTTFTPVDCTGLTRAKAYLSIELKCTNWESNGSIEIGSTVTIDEYEWQGSIDSLNITTGYQLFLLPLSDFSEASGAVDVSNIQRIRVIGHFSATETLAWRNARIIGKYYTPGNRLSPQLDLSAVGTVEDSSVSWTETLNGETITIETRISTDNGSNWTTWATCTNGNAIPDLPYGTDVSTGLLECKQTLSTSDPSVTPQLDSITVEISGEFGSFFMFPF